MLRSFSRVQAWCVAVHRVRVRYDLATKQVASVMSNSLDPMACSSSVHGILQARYWSELPCPPPGDLPHGIKLMSLMSPALAGEFFTIHTTWEAQLINTEKLCEFSLNKVVTK